MRLYSAYTAALCGLWVMWASGSGAQTPKRGDSAPSVSVSVVPQGANRDRTLTGHTDFVSALAFSPDSRHLVTGSVDTTAIVWDVATGRKLLTLKGNTAGITCATYSGDGKHIVTGCMDGSIRVWSAATGEKTMSLASPGAGAVAFDICADPTKLLCGYSNGQAKLWNIATGKSLLTLPYTGILSCVFLASDGSQIATGYLDGVARVWDAHTGHPLFTAKIPQKNVGITNLILLRQAKEHVLITFDREGEGEDMTLAGTVWELTSSKKYPLMKLPIAESTLGLALYGGDGTMLLRQSDGAALLLFFKGTDVGSMTQLNAHEGIILAGAISPDGTLGATGGARGKTGEAKLWDIKARRPAPDGK